MDRFRSEFDIAYDSSSMAVVNPLQVEQEAWKLLSPRVAGYLERFGHVIGSCSPDEITEELREQFLGLVKEGWDLLQKWNTISKAYNSKYEMAIYGVTDELCGDVDEREEAVRSLIRDLSPK